MNLQSTLLGLAMGLSLVTNSLAQCANNYPNVVPPIGSEATVRAMFVNDANDIFGNQTEINKLLNFADGIGINHLILYKVSDHLNEHLSIPGGTGIPQRQDLADFLTQAHQNQMTVSSVASNPTKAQDVIDYHNVFFVDQPEEEFDAIFYEYEYWNDYSYIGNTAFAFSLRYQPELTSINTLCQNNGLTCESYIGNPNTAAEVAFIKNTSDRIYATYYRQCPYDHSSGNLFNFKAQRLEWLGDAGSPSNKTEVILLFNAKQNSEGMYDWLKLYPAPTLNEEITRTPYEAWMYYHDGWDDHDGTSGYSHLNSIDMEGFCWYRYEELYDALYYVPPRHKSLFEAPTETSLLLSPNPGLNTVSIIGLTDLSKVHVEVIDLTGQLVARLRGHNVLDASQWSKGIYMIRVTSGTEQQVLRFVKR